MKDETRDTVGDRPPQRQNRFRAHRRIRSNVASGHRFLRARLKRRTRRPRIHWARYALVTAFLVAIVGSVFDLPVGHYRNQWPPELLLYARAMTNFGKSGWILVPTGLAVVIGYGMDWEVWGRRRRIFVLRWMALLGFIFFSIAAGGLIADIFKFGIGRARPEHFQALGAFAFEPLHNAGFASFPSGHATTVGGLFAAVALLLPRLRLPCLVLAVWFGCTRILVGAHYPSDVAAGLAWGAWFSYFSAMLFARHGIIFGYDANGWPVRRQGYRLLRSRRPRRRALQSERGSASS